MVNNSGSNSGGGDDSAKRSPDTTQVDLGEDLLAERTRTGMLRPARDGVPASVSPSSSYSEKTPRPFDADDEYASAKILLGEGLLEEAKKILRRILVRDSQYAPAILTLREIHEAELKQIFGDSPAPRRRRYLAHEPDPLPAPPTDVDAEEIVRGLDRDLKLSADSREKASLFASETELEAFAAKLDTDLAGLAGADRIDLGIAFRGMELHELAVRQFRAAYQYYERQETQDHSGILGASSLLAEALIAGGKGFEATQAIQGVLRDVEIPAHDKVELFYLMGRAYEALEKPQSAIQWYEKARGIDPYYRDATERVRVLTTGGSSA